MDIEEVIEAYWDTYYIEDSTIIETVLATVTSTVIEGDPVWLFLIAGSGGLKTELIRSLNEIGIVETRSKITPSAFIGGHNNSIDMLQQLQDNVLCIKDFTTVLTMKSYDRDELIGILRDSYDGYYGKQFHNGYKGYECHYTIIAGCVPVIEKYYNVNQELGERFLKLKVDVENRKESISRAIENVGNDDSIRNHIAVVVKEFVEQKIEETKKVQMLSLDSDLKTKLTDLCDFVSKARSSVSRDGYSKIVQCVPSPEYGTRLSKQLYKLMSCVAINRGKNEIEIEDYQVVQQVALHSIPSIRLKIYKSFYNGHNRGIDEELRFTDLLYATHLPNSTLELALQDMKILDLINWDGDSYLSLHDYIKPILEDGLKDEQTCD